MCSVHLTTAPETLRHVSAIVLLSLFLQNTHTQWKAAWTGKHEDAAPFIRYEVAQQTHWHILSGRSPAATVRTYWYMWTLSATAGLAVRGQWVHVKVSDTSNGKTHCSKHLSINIQCISLINSNREFIFPHCRTKSLQLFNFLYPYYYHLPIHIRFCSFITKSNCYG